MRHFSQLTSTKLREIYIGFLAEEPKLRIARRLGIDNSTVHYHINKIKALPRTQVYALVAPPCCHGHTSLKCLVCGKPFDNMMSDEFQEIVRLRRRVETLERELNSRNEIHSSGSSSDSGFSPAIGLRLPR